LRRKLVQLGEFSDEDFERIPKLVLGRAGYSRICKFCLCGGAERGNDLGECLFGQNRLRRAAATPRLIRGNF
jgi:hypothetical protein